MLTRELAIAEYDFRRGRILPDRLTQRLHRQYVDYADGMLRVYRAGAGRTRRDLHRAVHAIFQDEEDCPTRRIDAFCKLLDDASTYERVAVHFMRSMQRPESSQGFQRGERAD